MIRIVSRGLNKVISKYQRASGGIPKDTRAQMDKLADELIASLRESMTGANVTGRMSDSINKKWEGQKTIVIGDKVPYSKYFIRGTTGPYRGVPYSPIVKWAMARGLSKSAGFAIARHIAAHGTMSRSHRKLYRPYGEGTGFDLYSYVMDVTMKNRIAEYPDLIVERIINEYNL